MNNKKITIKQGASYDQIVFAFAGVITRAILDLLLTNERMMDFAEILLDMQMEGEKENGKH